MSMDRCHDCGRAVDTDDDPGCYIEIGNQRRLHKEVCICEPCREARIEEQEIVRGDVDEQLNARAKQAGG